MFVTAQGKPAEQREESLDGYHERDHSHRVPGFFYTLSLKEEMTATCSCDDKCFRWKLMFFGTSEFYHPLVRTLPTRCAEGLSIRFLWNVYHVESTHEDFSHDDDDDLYKTQ